MTCLSHLHEIRYALTIIQKSHPDHSIADDINRIDILIGQMGAVGRMWRLGDTALLAMCHGLDAPATLTETVLDRSGPKGKICQHAQEGGFIRLASGRSVMVMSTAPNNAALTGMMDADAAANAVEFSFQRQRILISGGHHHALSKTYPNLAELMKGTSAHSTLSIDMINASQLTDQLADKSSVQNRNRSPSGTRQAVSTMAECGPATGGMLAVATHNGYQSLFGALHEENCFLPQAGIS